MDFFERQEKARRNTKLLVFYFTLAVIVLVVMGYFAGLMIFTGAQSRHHHYSNQEIQFALWNPQVFLAALIGTLGVIIGGSAFKTAQLAEGGSAVATTLGGRPIASNTTDPDERKLLNVVEEMAIASGVPMPQVYVLDEEQGINAFAAGHTPSDAAIGVTRGCITLLKRDELQGVIGHEFSHILNGDMRLNLRLLGVIFGILCIATLGRILLRTRGGSRDRNALPLLGLALLLLGSAGVFFGRLIQAAVSRQREFLADASSVQFTRNPAGLSGALQKIGRYSFGSRLESEHAADACHMFFGNGLSEPFFGLMATHPPIGERIHALDPGWDGKFPPIPKELFEPVQRAAISDLKHSPLPSILNTVLGGAVIAAGSTPPVIKPNSVLPNIGNPTPLHLRYAEELRNSFPESVKSAAHEPLSAVALVYSLLLSGDETTRATQLQELTQRTAFTIHEKTAALLPEVAPIALRARLPLVTLALPSLRQLRPDEFEQFSQTLKWLIESDREIDLFEFVLQKIIRRHLAPRFGKTRPPVIQYYSIKPLLPECNVVLSALANVGSSSAGEVEKAFATGAPYLRSPEGTLQLLPNAECDLAQIDAALDLLAQAVPQIKKNLLEACVYTIGTDGVIQEREAELLRAIADTLDCPIPPFVQME